MRRRTVLINCLLALGSLVVFFAVIEIGLRITGLQTVTPNPPRIYQTNRNPRISIELIPNIQRKAYRQIVTTNSLGFRSPEPDRTKPVIAVLGDSIAFGYGLADDETIPARLQELLPNYNVLNTAVPAHQLAQQTAIFETKVQPFDPAAVALIFYWNDFTAKTPFLDDQGIVRQEGWTPDQEHCYALERGLLRFIPAQCWLKEHSAFYKAFEKLVNMRTAREELQQQRTQSLEHPEDDTVTASDLALYEVQLKEFVALFARSIPRLFVIWPDRTLHAVSRPRLRALAEVEGFVVIDLYDTFGNSVPVLGWDTVHPNAEAAKTAAAKIAEALRPLLE